MRNDLRDQSLARLLRAARHAPPVGLERRALAALADIRPRRHPNLVTIIIVIALILLLAAGVFAAVRSFFYVQGTLRFHDSTYDPQAERWIGRARILSGELEWETEPDLTLLAGDISPDGTRVVHGEGGEWPPGPDSTGPILISNLDGSDQVNLAEIAGIGGVNCNPKWSPDGTMIAFSHCDPVEGLLPCDAGYYLWVMNVDGSDAHRVTPEGAPPIGTYITWSPDSSRLAVCPSWGTRGDEPVTGPEWPTDMLPYTTDVWGTDIRPLPNVGWEIAWSPNGSMLVSIRERDGEVGGAAGHWTQLLLTDADGGHPRVLVEQFVSDADSLAHLARYRDRPGHDVGPEGWWQSGVRYWAGPCRPVWSPNGDQIAFLAGMPFDPDGPYLKDQTEVWVYDLNTDELIRVTDDDVGQMSVIWK